MEQFKKSSTVISRITLCDDEHDRYLGDILLESGEVQRPSWSGLYRHWNYAKPAVVNYSAASHSGCFAVFSFTVESGQGGIIAIWNTIERRWQQVSEASYVVCSMLLEEVPAVISLHYV